MINQITFEEVEFQILARPILLGDTYLAQRNTSPKLLTAKIVDEANGWVVPEEVGEYVFDVCECTPANSGDHQ